MQMKRLMLIHLLLIKQQKDSAILIMWPWVLNSSANFIYTSIMKDK